jgi:hypothetical protein
MLYSRAFVIRFRAASALAFLLTFERCRRSAWCCGADRAFEGLGEAYEGEADAHNGGAHPPATGPLRTGQVTCSAQLVHAPHS